MMTIRHPIWSNRSSTVHRWRLLLTCWYRRIVPKLPGSRFRENALMGLMQGQMEPEDSQTFAHQELKLLKKWSTQAWAFSLDTSSFSSLERPSIQHISYINRRCGLALFHFRLVLCIWSGTYLTLRWLSFLNWYIATYFSAQMTPALWLNWRPLPARFASSQCKHEHHFQQTTSIIEGNVEEHTSEMSGTNTGWRFEHYRIWYPAKRAIVTDRQQRISESISSRVGIDM